MKFWLCLFVFLLTGNAGLRAQKNDYVWLQGYDSKDGFIQNRGFYLGTTVMDFNVSPRRLSYDSLSMNFDFTNTSYCDDNGNLLFYTNGIYIANSLHEKIENSDSLNTGYFQYNWAPNVQEYGYRSPYGIYALPMKFEQYYVVHSWLDTFGSNGLLCKKILSTFLDMSLNTEHGKVIYKNNTIIYDSLGTELAVTRHGNGKDWWIIAQKRNSNCYFRMLLSENGITVLPDMACGGTAVDLGYIGAACFSPDGSKYIYFSGQGSLNIFDFDRCTGEFNNPLTRPMPNAGWIGMGLAVSPNNRFLYANYSPYLFQFDLEATDIMASIDTVGVYDGTNAPFPAYFHTQQLGPDGKIYMSCGNSDTVYHVIERPDEKGDSCLFHQHGLVLPSLCTGVPSFPNYRLGALPGSSCDTLTGLNDVARAEKEKLLKVFPNPATNFVTVDYGFIDWNKGEVSLEITNELGQVVHQQPVPMYSGFQKIEVQNFAPGMYTAFIKRKGKVVATAKFAKQ